MVNLQSQYGFGWITNLSQALNLLVTPALSIAGVAVLIYFLIGAIKFIFSGGDKQAVQSGKDMITHAIIGLVLLLLMFIIIYFVTEFLGIGYFFVEPPK